jgi:hypothetical protein
LKVIAGSTSYASSRGEISIGSYHASGRWSHLESVTGAYGGAPPAGWPDPGWGATAEEWADCVSLAFTGIVDPSYGMPPCDGDSLSWTQSYLAAGPG